MKEKEIRKALAGKLHAYRLQAGYTAKQVGQMIGKSEKTVSGWEHGRGQPDADVLFQLCEIYNIKNISELYYTNLDALNVPSLSEDESKLLSLYRSLNSAGREMLLNTACGFAGNPDLKKEQPDTNTETA